MLCVVTEGLLRQLHDFTRVAFEFIRHECGDAFSRGMAVSAALPRQAPEGFACSTVERLRPVDPSIAGPLLQALAIGGEAVFPRLAAQASNAGQFSGGEFRAGLPAFAAEGDGVRVLATHRRLHLPKTWL